MVVEDILQLQITVANGESVEIAQSVEEHTEDPHRFGFGKVALLYDPLKQLSASCKLENHVDFSLSLKRLDQLNYVWMLHTTQYR